VECDLLLTSVGVDPATDWLRDSPVKLDDGVVCDSTGATSVPNVVACGDVASYFDARVGEHRRGQHWTAAMEQPEAAARTLLRPEDPGRYEALPYFWTEQHGLDIQIAGYVSGHGRLELIQGSLADRSFQAGIRVGDRVEAVVAVNAPSGFAAHRDRLAGTLHDGR
jgi:3-phenylpropionate/trans-cinnamate dioxygenase ferredoxin reductase component